jgi:hypothetical protein
MSIQTALLISTDFVDLKLDLQNFASLLHSRNILVTSQSNFLFEAAEKK